MSSLTDTSLIWKNRDLGKCEYLSGSGFGHIVIAEWKGEEAERRDGISMALEWDVVRSGDHSERFGQLLFHQALTCHRTHEYGSVLNELRTGHSAVHLTEAFAALQWLLLTDTRKAKNRQKQSFNHCSTLFANSGDSIVCGFGRKQLELIEVQNHLIECSIVCLFSILISF